MDKRKNEELRQIRRQLGLSQKDMAERLNIGSAYLSQLENNRKEIQSWILKSARNLLESHEQTQRHADPARIKCHTYLDRVLDSCEGDPDRYSWVYIELTRTFPMDPANSASAAKNIVDRTAAAYEASRPAHKASPPPPPAPLPQPASSHTTSSPSPPQTRGRKKTS